MTTSKQFGMSPDEEVAAREQFREYNKKRKRASSNGYNFKLSNILLAGMDRVNVYTNEDLALFLIGKGLTPAGVGPATTFMVDEGYASRVGRGLYRKLRDIGEGAPMPPPPLNGQASHEPEMDEPDETDEAREADQVEEGIGS